MGISNGNKKDRSAMVKVQPIVAVLEEYVGRNNITLLELSRRLGVAHSTMTAIMRGDRQMPVDSELRDRLAELLDVSGLQIAVWCGLLSGADFVVRNDDGDKLLDSVLDRVRADPSVGVSAPSDRAWAETPREVKVMLAHIYQQFVGQRLLPTAKLQAQPA
jgi:transcriptional regulator with XRE-family HTH domain